MAGLRVTVFVLVLAAFSQTIVDGSDQRPIKWILNTQGEEPPTNAIYGGFTRNDKDYPIYVARIWVDSAIIPAGTTKKDKFYAYGALQGKMYPGYSVFEVAVAHASAVRWVPAAQGVVPEGAVPAGVTSDGEPLYVCRVLDYNISVGNHKFMMSVGALDPKSKGCSCEFHGPHLHPTYEVLVVVNHTVKS